MTDKIETKNIELKELISVMVTGAVFNGFKYIWESFDTEKRELLIREIEIEFKRQKSNEISKEECVARIFEVISKNLRTT